MKTENGMYIDDKNNRWDTCLYSKEKAEKLSKSMVDCSNCRNCSDCSKCHDCRDCRDCSNFKENPQRVTSSKVGSREGITTVYWVSRMVEQVICGCFRGDLDSFEKDVFEKHRDNEHIKSYLKFINNVKIYMENSK